jgi:hypothetical protein
MGRHAFTEILLQGVCKIAEAFGGALGTDIALRSSQHLEANHEFSDGRGAEERRIKMSVKMTLRVTAAIGRRLVEAR